MPFFGYKAKDDQGRLFKGLVQAADETVAKNILEEKSLSIIYLKLTRRRGSSLSSLFLPSLSSKDLVVLSRQLSILVNSDMPLVEALDALIRQTENQRVRLVVSQVSDSVRGGMKLSEALGQYPKVFNNFYVRLVQTGEQVGKLDEVLEYLADEQEKSYDMRSKVKGMMIYPAFVFVMLVAIVIFMMIFVVPKMLLILKEANVELPLSTRMLMAVSDFMVNDGWLLAFMVLIVGLAFYFYTSFDRGKEQWDFIKLKTPFVGTILQNVAIVNIANSLSLLLKGGVDMVTALKTVSESLNNAVYRKLMMRATKEVEDGNYLADTLASSSVIPYMVTAMVQVGEKTGRLDGSLDKITSFYGREVQNSLNNLVSLIEPLVIVVMGIGVAIVVAAMILPMYQVVSAI